MSRLQERQEKIQEKRKKTPWREFVMEIASWLPFVLYRNNGLISKFPDIGNISVMGHEEFEAYRDTLVDHGLDMGDMHNTSFFETLQTLLGSVRLPNTMRRGVCEKVDYAETIISCSNAYLSHTVVTDCEHVLYSFNVKDHCHDVINSVYVQDNSSIIANSLGIFKSQRVFYSKYIFDSFNIWFSANLQNCQECLFCNNLTNKSYCIKNEQYTKEAYQTKKEQLLRDKHLYNTYMNDLTFPAENYASEHSTGTLILKSNDVENGFCVYQLDRGRNCLFTASANCNENYFDVVCAGSPHGDDYYGVLSAGAGDHYYCSCHIVAGANIFYSYFLGGCSYCLGCIGLKNKSFCIFNKQYTKEERHEKVDEIFTKMEEEGTLGEFFPGSMNPFYFNDTAAYLIDDTFTKEEVEAKGYLWRDEVVKVDIPEGIEVVKVEDLGQYEGWIRRDALHASGNNSVGTQFIASADITDDRQSETGLSSDPSTSSGGQIGERRIDPSILKKVIQDEQGNVYRIVKMEYDFLMKHGLPLPRKHRLERLKMNFRIS